MLESRLELSSAHGDQTIAGVRFVAIGTDAAAAHNMAEHGLSFAPGAGLVTTNLPEAYEQATKHSEGTITVLAVPKEFHLGYATFTTAFIERYDQRVVGAPMRYAAARRLLAFYLDADTEAARRKVEAVVEQGRPFSEHVRYNIDPANVLGRFAANSAMHSLLTGLQVSADAFEAIDFARVEGALAQLFDCREPAQVVLVPTLVRDLVAGTVESVILSRLRVMRWQGLALLGYTIHEGNRDVAVTRVSDVAEQRRRIERCRQSIASSNLFNGELAWLKVYAVHELDLMRVELDGAELEAA